MPSRVRVEGPIPIERMPHGEIVQTPGAFAPGTIPSPTPPPTPPTSTQTGSIFLYPGERSITHNTSGTEITLKDLSDINPDFSPVIYSYPGTDADRNDTQWIVACPSDMAAVPNIRIRLHLIGLAS